MKVARFTWLTGYMRRFSSFIWYSRGDKKRWTFTFFFIRLKGLTFNEVHARYYKGWVERETSKEGEIKHKWRDTSTDQMNKGNESGENTVKRKKHDQYIMKVAR